MTRRSGEEEREQSRTPGANLQQHPPEGEGEPEDGEK